MGKKWLKYPKSRLKIIIVILNQSIKVGKHMYSQSPFSLLIWSSDTEGMQVLSLFIGIHW